MTDPRALVAPAPPLGHSPLTGAPNGPGVSMSRGNPSAPRCDHWPGDGSRCAGAGTLVLFAPDGDRVPGGPICKRCAHAITTEYREKLGEVWTTRPAEQIP